MHARKLHALAAAAALAATVFANEPSVPTEPPDVAPSGSSEPAAAAPAMPLPEGWTAEDMQACMLAATPGDMHKHLAKSIGTWHGKTTMWMFAGAPPVESECTSIVTPVMDGRYIKCEMAGETPGIGPYTGMGIYGFDNVSQKFVCTWIDNWSTGLMNGIGDLTADATATHWNFSYNCPVTKKQAVIRQTETITGPDTKTLEMIATDPKTGVEFKMMHIAFTKK